MHRLISIGIVLTLCLGFVGIAAAGGNHHHGTPPAVWWGLGAGAVLNQST